MVPDDRGEKGPELFQEIADFWSAQLNNEIFLRGHSDVERGSREYFDIILAARRKYIYYFPRMIGHLQASPDNSLLEVGCGMGTDTIVFAKSGFEVTGIDLAPGHLHLAERLFELYHTPGKFLQGNAEDLPFPNQKFGCVYSFGVLHHTPNTLGAIHEIHRVLKPGGRGVIMLYHLRSLNNLAHWITGKGFENARREDGTPGDAPVTQRFTRNQVRQMCSIFDKCEIHTEYLYGAGWGKIYDHTPKSVYHLLSRVVGWHLVVYLVK
jgi:ubiquinone/menaquinone biosynthesis C-methylase UbiE